MTNFTWVVRDRNVIGVGTPVSGSVTLPWSADDAFAGQTLPWAKPEYPTLLITGIGCTLTTSAVVASRRVRAQVIQPNNASMELINATAITASLTRRIEFAAGTSLGTPLADNVLRESMPRGFMLLPGLQNGPECQFQLTTSNFQVGDSLGDVTIRGVLLYP